MVKNGPQIYPNLPPRHDPPRHEFGTASDKSFFDIFVSSLSRRCACDKAKRHVSTWQLVRRLSWCQRLGVPRSQELSCSCRSCNQKTLHKSQKLSSRSLLIVSTTHIAPNSAAYKRYPSTPLYPVFAPKPIKPHSHITREAAKTKVFFFFWIIYN